MNNNQTSRWLAVAALTLLASTAVQAQKLYKWVDENGNVYYSDQVPPEHQDHAREELNEQGLVVDQVDRAKTEEELAAERERRRLEAERRKVAELQRKEDQKMLASYASEEDIIRIRRMRVDSLDRAIAAAQAFVSGQTKSLADLMERAAYSESRGEPVSDALSSAIDTARREIVEQEDYIARREAEKGRVIAEYEEELQRYLEVKARYTAQDG